MPRQGKAFRAEKREGERGEGEERGGPGAEARPNSTQTEGGGVAFVPGLGEAACPLRLNQGQRPVESKDLAV